MNDALKHPLAMDGKDRTNLRGDPITPERYYSKEWMEKEWDQLWTKIWHIAGREQQLQEPGDYIVHDFMHESVIIAKQKDGSLKGFYNACGHRAQRLVWGQYGSQESLFCPYHGWKWDMDGSLLDACDRDDYPEDPVGKIRLVEVRVDTWAGLVWYTMDDEAPDLYKYLEPWPEIYKNHQFEKTVRARWIRVALECNWKFWSDNFNESYHTRTAHPQVPPIIDQDHFSSYYEMYPMGNNRIVQMGRPSVRDRVPEGEPHPWDRELEYWGIDPNEYPDYETKAIQGWLDLKAAKRKLWKEKGHLHYENLTDEELTESPFTTIFPNIAFGASADGFGVFRWEPHPTDPEKCFFDEWSMAYPVEGVESYVHRTARYGLKFEEAEYDYREYDNGNGVQDLDDQVVFQDWQLNAGQTTGWRSRGYQEPYLANQETRVRRFHEVLHDYLNGNPPGRK
ncbi:MAG: (2Fe-2S)-binding protein [Gammaproteobacteria bacterium]|nr:(2Fe-2S)-binding protein [Gammaproteobacteria bacterium]|tara:strand:+ start:2125 stop:3477 length:1353 start_codon:yes stop_codon:yes gene_type:complete